MGKNLIACEDLGGKFPLIYGGFSPNPISFNQFDIESYPSLVDRGAL